MPKRPEAISQLPQSVPVFPLSGALLLPHTQRPLNIFEPRYLDMVDYALGADRLIGLVQPSDAREESPKGSVPLRSTGCLGRIVHFDEMADDRYVIVLEGLIRFDCGEEIITDRKFREFAIDASRFAEDFDPEFGEHAVDRPRFLSMMKDYAEFAQLDIDWEEIEQTGTAELINFAAMMSPYGPAEKQMLLEAETLALRADTLMALAELEIARSKAGTTLQ